VEAQPLSSAAVFAMHTGDESKTIRILAADDHPLLREGIVSLIANQPELVLVGEASTGREAIEKHRALRPDVTLMDLQMPDIHGIDAIMSIRQEFPLAKIVVLTTFSGDVLAQRAIKAGAQAYILKSHVRKELIDVIRSVYLGHKRIQGQVAADIADHLADPGLSVREIAVLELVAQGNSNRAVGKLLHINEDTVKGHVKSILAKLGAKDRTHAVTIGLRRGIIQM
jgi:DNA-binding NarL/FixJ family response regulator